LQAAGAEQSPPRAAFGPAGRSNPVVPGARIEVMPDARARRRTHLPLLVLLALVAGLRAGLAAPASAPLPPPAGVSPGAGPVDVGGLAHATFAVG